MRPITLEQFLSRAEESPTGCWLWTGPLDKDGYGVAKRTGFRGAHRVSWVMHGGTIPDGFQLDHLCRVRHCVRPDHLDLVTSRENTLRGYNHAAQNARKTECLRGHPLSGSNLRLYRGRRVCRTCNNASSCAAKRKRRAA